MNNEGAISTALSGSSGEDSSSAYTQIYRNGVIEAVRVGLLDTHVPGRIYLQRYEETVRNYLPHCFKILDELGCRPPVVVGVALFGVRGFKILHPAEMFGEHSGKTIDIDPLLLPEVVFEDLTANTGMLLKPAFDRAWNAAGFVSSPYFDENDKWNHNTPNR